MQHMRCKCGDSTLWTSMGAGPDCYGCEKCRTTFAKHSEHHRKLQPHEFGIRFNQDTGKPYKVCKKCHHVDQKSKAESDIKDDIPDDELLGMTKKRYNFLSQGGEDNELTKEEIEAGWHFCSEWNYMLIHKTWVQFKFCECSKKEKVKEEIEICICESVETTDVAKWDGVYHHVLCKKPISND